MASLSHCAQYTKGQADDTLLWDHLFVEWIDVSTGDCWLESMVAVANSMMPPWPTVAVPGAASRPILPDELMGNNTEVSKHALHILSLLLEDDHEYVKAIFNASGMEGPPDTAEWREHAPHGGSANTVTMTCVLTASEIGKRRLQDWPESVLVADGLAGAQ